MDTMSFVVGVIVGAVVGVVVGIILKDIIGGKLTSITRDESGRIIEVLENHV